MGLRGGPTVCCSEACAVTNSVGCGGERLVGLEVPVQATGGWLPATEQRLVEEMRRAALSHNLCKVGAKPGLLEGPPELWQLWSWDSELVQSQGRARDLQRQGPCLFHSPGSGLSQ